MKIEMRLFASLRKYSMLLAEDNALVLPEGSSVDDLFRKLKIDAEEVKIIMVNGVHHTQDYVLRDGDRVGLFPPVGGG